MLNAARSGFGAATKITRKSGALNSQPFFGVGVM